MLELNNIWFWYTSQVNLFEHVSINIGTWNIVWLYGPSWTWKTTLLKIIGWLLKPTYWTVSFKNKNIFDFDYSMLASYRNQDVWFVFQNFNLLDDFKVEENIMLPFTISSSNSLYFDQDWYDYLLEYFDIKKLIWKNVNSISWGEKQRVSIVKALIHKPKILLMDEPTTYLNVELSKKFFKLIQDYSKNNICIFVSHEESVRSYFWLNVFTTYGDIIVYSNKS